MTIKATTQRFPLDQLLQCGRCGGPLHLVENTPEEPTYTCAGSADETDHARRRPCWQRI